jgi:hypothetical protein
MLFNFLGGILTDRIGRVKQFGMFSTPLFGGTDEAYSYWTLGMLVLLGHVRNPDCALRRHGQQTRQCCSYIFHFSFCVFVSESPDF